MLKIITIFVFTMILIGCSTLKVQVAAPEGYFVKFKGIKQKEITRNFSANQNIKDFIFVRDIDDARIVTQMQITSLFKEKKISKVSFCPEKKDLDQLIVSNNFLTIGIVDPEFHNNVFLLKTITSRITLMPDPKGNRRMIFNNHLFTTKTWQEKNNYWRTIAKITLGSKSK